ncbi:hypothetical protein [Psychromonas sp. SP041]|uniref:hypothetical protein n=1 Tax=Psychromonas sp. SP041 TaxID=1365007 RepID=UPI0004292876|nr:hypothetical protein [Psychromonas sp. SP041]
MLIFYIICGVLVFAGSGLFMHINRLAIYRRRIIRQLATNSKQMPFILSESQEQKIKQSFLKGLSVKECQKEL